MDLSDQLIEKAYSWQVETDPQNTPTYLSNLRYIASQRQSEILETAVAVETSQGRFDAETLNKAYRAFQLVGRESLVNDEDIIGSFAATLADSPLHELDLREYLRIIGVHRNSKRIMDISQNGKEVSRPEASSSNNLLHSYRQLRTGPRISWRRPNDRRRAYSGTVYSQGLRHSPVSSCTLLIFFILDKREQRVGRAGYPGSSLDCTASQEPTSLEMDRFGLLERNANGCCRGLPSASNSAPRD